MEDDNLPESGTPADTVEVRPPRRWPVVVAAALALAAAAFWAGRLTLTPPTTVAEGTDDQVLVAVTERTIGQTLDYGARTSRTASPVATNSLTGVVTAMGDVVAERKMGDVLYEVAGLPVRAVAGATPFHRDLVPGASGKDVTQLEAALVSLGLLPSADAVFDAATSQAVSAWQRKLGSPVTGTVRLGELVAIPALPASVVLDEKVVWLGAVLNGGEVAVSVGAGEPSFVLPLSPGQLALVPADAPMTVEGLGMSWPAVWESSGPNAQLGVGELVVLAAPGGGPVCADACDVVPALETWVTVHIEVVPKTTGPAVPIAAVSTDAAGQAWVTVVDGERREKRAVTVTRAHAGLAVVEGVTIGEIVQAVETGDPEAEAPVPTPTPSETP